MCSEYTKKKNHSQYFLLKNLQDEKWGRKIVKQKLIEKFHEELCAIYSKLFLVRRKKRIIFSKGGLKR